jgi:hypothetical protein
MVVETMYANHTLKVVAPLGLATLAFSIFLLVALRSVLPPAVLYLASSAPERL